MLLAEVVLPDAEVDATGFVEAVVTAILPAVVVVVGAYFAFLLIKLSLRWARKAGG